MESRSLRYGRVAVGVVGVAFPCACQRTPIDGADASSPGSGGAHAVATGSTVVPKDASTPGDASGDAPADSDPEPDANFEEIPSNRTVTVRVTNGGVQTLYLVTQGALCSELGIERGSDGVWASLPTEVVITSPDVGCDHWIDYNGTGPRILHALDPGATFDLKWDGRAYVFSQQTFECAGFGTFHYAVKQPVPPGAFRATIGYFSAPPDGAFELNGSWHCPTGFDFPKPMNEHCEAGAFASANFGLDSSLDDVVVDVSIP